MRKSRLSKHAIVKLIENFVTGVSARSAAVVCEVSILTAMRWYQKFRALIFHNISASSYIFDGEVECDESYFGGQRKGKRGRGAAGKVAVFGILKRNGYVHAISVENTRASTLYPIIQKRVIPDSIVYTDTYAPYNILDTSRFHHMMN